MKGTDQNHLVLVFKLLNCTIQNRCNKVAIDLRVMQSWSEIILVISDQIALHS